jgi:hypothetical protein
MHFVVTSQSTITMHTPIINFVAKHKEVYMGERCSGETPPPLG